MKSGVFFYALIMFFSASFIADGMADCPAPELIGDERWYGTHPEPLYTISQLHRPSNLDSTGVVAHIEAAANSWGQATPWFDFQENGENMAFVNTYIDCEDQTNQNNLFGWDDYSPLWIEDEKLTGILGVTRVCKTQTRGSSGKWLINFVHTILNWNIDGSNPGIYTWSLNPVPPQPGDYQFDVQSSAAHEFGHWLRLTHLSQSQYPDFPTMTQVDDFFDLAGSTAWRSLECEDRWGINEIYDGSPSVPLDVMSTPRVSMLYQNVPNPANPETWIPFELSYDADVIIRIYNPKGSLIRTLDLGHKALGFYTVHKGQDSAAHWDGRDAANEPVAPGVYYYHLSAGDFSAVRKLMLN